MINQFDRVLACYSVTRTLYDSDKSIYDILCRYISAVIVDSNTYSFNLTWITREVNDLGGFDIKEPIIKTCLNRMGIEHLGTDYTCNIEKIRVGSNWTDAYEDAKKDNEYLMDVFLGYLEREVGYDIHSQTKNYYARSLCEYLLSEGISSNHQITKHISQFILENTYNEKISKILLHLKEGTIIHEGIKYSESLAEINSVWKDQLVIYLDTEILLGICGYNSSLLQSYCKDFMQYIGELNRKAKRDKRISLRYFKDTYNELDIFFETGKRIIQGKEIADPTKEAIQQIINGCKYPSDIELKRTIFFDRLSKAGIKEEQRDFYNLSNEDNKTYNIEQNDLEKKFAKEKNYQINDVHRSLAVLSHINIIRKGHNNTSFEKCKAIFITATNRTKRLAFAPEIYNESDVPLASSLDFIINRFWLRLHKGFGEGDEPQTLDMVSQARTLLSGLLNDRVLLEFNKLKTSYENGELSKEDFFVANYDLREKLPRVDDINIDRFNKEMRELDEWNFHDVQAKYEFQKERLIEAKKENQRLLAEINQQQGIHMQEKESAAKKYAEIILSYEEKLGQQEKNIEERNNQILELKQENKKRNRKHAIIVITIYFCGVIAGAIYYIVGTYHNWKYSATIGSIITFISVIGFLKNMARQIWDKITGGDSIE